MNQESEISNFPNVSGNGRIRVRYEKIQGQDDYKSWKASIDSVFQRFQKVSKFSYEYKIYPNSNFNAGVFSNHKEGKPAQVLVFTGTLDSLDQYLWENNLPFCKSEKECREILLSPILAHELAHYFQNDNFEIGKILSNKNLEKEEQSEKIRGLEIQADLYAKELLIRTGVTKDSSILILILEIIKKHIKKGKSKIENVQNRPDYYNYESFHPSLNERLVKLGEIKYQLPYELDKNFSIIRNQFSTNTLASACLALEAARYRFPENTELKREMAICYHKLWYSTAGENCMKFIPIIDAPAFSDDSLFVSKKADSCGDPEYYKKALQLYEELLEILESDDKLLSNYEILLLYSSDVLGKKKESKTKKFLFQKIGSRIPTFLDKESLNNYGIIQYFRGNKNLAELIFLKLSGSVMESQDSLSEYNRFNFCTFQLNLVLFQIENTKKTSFKNLEILNECNSNWKDYIQKKIEKKI